MGNGNPQNLHAVCPALVPSLAAVARVLDAASVAYVIHGKAAAIYYGVWSETRPSDIDIRTEEEGIARAAVGLGSPARDQTITSHHMRARKATFDYAGVPVDLCERRYRRGKNAQFGTCIAYLTPPEETEIAGSPVAFAGVTDVLANYLAASILPCRQADGKARADVEISARLAREFRGEIDPGEVDKILLLERGFGLERFAGTPAYSELVRTR